MRSRSFLILVSLVTTLVIAILTMGCSDDETPLTTVPANGDSEFQAQLDVVSEQIHTFLDSAVEVMDAGLSVATWTDVGTDVGDIFMGSIDPDSTVETDWIVSWATDLQSGLGAINIIDSLTYVVDGELNVNARGADQMYVKHNYSWLTDDTTVTFANVSQRANLHIDGIDGSVATINGDFRSEIYDKTVETGETSWNIWVVEGTVTDLQMAKTSYSWTSGCPNTGTCEISVQYTSARNDELPVTTLWHFTVTFTDGQMAVDVTIGNLSASYEEDLCTP